jgi:hypothetical protein
MLPTLSQIYSWDTEHLIEAADHWTKTADQWEDAFIQMRNQSHTITWEGAGGDALRSRTTADLAIVSAKAERLLQVSRIAREGAGTIGAAQRRVLYAVEDARDDGFTVAEDLSVTDASTSCTPAEQVSRRVQAQALTGDIRQRATQLITLEHEVAAENTTATAGIAAIKFPQTPHHHKPHIQVVDHTSKQGPDQPIPTPSPTADDIRRVLDKLPRGSDPRIREVRSQQDLDNLWNWMRQNGVERPGGYGMVPGEMKDLPDGTIVGRREAADSTKQPALDVRVPGDGGYTKIHINPERGGVPEIPARSGPAEPPLRPTDPAERTPAEARPAEPPRPEPGVTALAPPVRPAPAEPPPGPPPAPPRPGGFGGGSIGGGGGGTLPGHHGSIWEPAE